MTDPRTANNDLRATARQALEEICARGDMAAAPRYYREDFVDHVNDRDYHGLEGVRASVESYRSVLMDLRIEVVEQVAQDETVVSRWQATGSYRGRSVTLWGITTSRFRDGRIAEDWSASDNLSLLRQLGVWRTLAVGAEQLVGLIRR